MLNNALSQHISIYSTNYTIFDVASTTDPCIQYAVSMLMYTLTDLIELLRKENGHIVSLFTVYRTGAGTPFYSRENGIRTNFPGVSVPALGPTAVETR